MLIVKNIETPTFFFSPEKLTWLVLLKEVKASLDRKMTKLSSFLISDNIFAKTRSRSDDDGYRVFPPK